MWPCLYDDKCLSGNKVSSVISAQCPSPSVLSPKPSFPFKLGGEGFISAAIINRPMGSTSWWLDLAWSHHSVAGLLGSWRDILFLPFPQRLLLAWLGGSWRLLVGSHWVILKWGSGPRAWYCCGKSLPLVDPALMSDILAWADPAQSGCQVSTVRNQ